MCASWSDASSDGRAKKTNYKVRFRHGVFPHSESRATRADFKAYDYFFGSGQKWVGLPNQFDFVNESAQIAEDSGGPAAAASKIANVGKAKRPLTRSKTAERIATSTSKTSPQTKALSIRPAGGTLTDRTCVPAAKPTSANPWQITSHPRCHTSPAPGSVSSFSSLDDSLGSSWRGDMPSPGTRPTIRQCTPVVWPLEDPVEAHLYRFWVDKAADWWDITNVDGIFKEVVPKLALRNSMLMNAIFMIAAQHIQRFDPQFPARPYFYHERILQCLIPYLQEKGRIEDEATLVAAMLLRSFEEFHAGTQGQKHLSTFELFQGPEGWLFDLSSTVVQACLMVHVHCEIFQGLVNRLDLRIDYANFILPSLITPANDAAWGNRIVWLSARILQWAERDIRTAYEWQGLVDLVNQWERDRPASFDAFFYRKEGMDAVRYLPELWFSGPCHADSNQHLRICRIALATNCPDVDIQEPNRAGAAASLRNEVLRGLKEMVAVALCNLHAVSAPWVAAHAVHKYAVVLQDDWNRSKMIEFLEEVNAMGWPTTASMEHLREQWRWSLGYSLGMSGNELS